MKIFKRRISNKRLEEILEINYEIEETLEKIISDQEKEIKFLRKQQSLHMSKISKAQNILGGKNEK